MDFRPADVYLAKWVYESFARITIQTFGPTWRFPPEAEKVFEALTPALNGLISQETQPVPGRVWEVPSPWHAALYLSALQHHLALKGRRALFRGQGDSRWEIQASIARQGVDQDAERKRAQTFCELLSSLSFNTFAILHPSTNTNFDLRISPDSYLAAAQHYQIRTNLIDFTTDPAIAVFFAASEKHTSPGQTASVFVLFLQAALKLNCEIILPPPFVERLYTQRGVFLRSDGVIDRSALGLLEVRFPAAYEFAPFQVIRSHSGLVDVLADSKAMQNVLRATDENPASRQNLKESFADVYKHPLEMWAKYVDFFEDQLYWLAYQVDESKEILYSDMLQPILSKNREVALAAIQFYRWSAKLPLEAAERAEEKRAHILRLANLLEEMIDGKHASA